MCFRVSYSSVSIIPMASCIPKTAWSHYTNKLKPQISDIRVVSLLLGETFTREILAAFIYLIGLREKQPLSAEQTGLRKIGLLFLYLHKKKR